MGNTIEKENSQNILAKINNIKIMLIGPSLSGKTTLIDSYIRQEYIEHESTIGVEFFTITKKNTTPHRIVEGYGFSSTNYHIYDTTGIQKYKHILNSYYQVVQSIILVIEHSNNNYMNIIPRFFDDIVNYGKVPIENKIIFVVINVKNIGKMNNTDRSDDIIKLCRSISKNIIIHKLNIMDRDMLNDTMEKILDRSAVNL